MTSSGQIQVNYFYFLIKFRRCHNWRKVFSSTEDSDDTYESGSGSGSGIESDDDDDDDSGSGNKLRFS